jgi:hypothetical protein
MSVKTYRVAPTFWYDYLRRDLATPEMVEHENSNHVFVMLNPAQYHELLSDAEYYSQDDDDWWAEGLEPLRASAKRVVVALKKAGPPA